MTETILLKLPRMLPYAAPGRSALQPALERPLGRVQLAGDYLGGVYTDTAISSGQEAALAVRTALQAAAVHDLRRRRVRSRFNNVVNARDVPQEDYSEPSGRYQVGAREIAEAAGARDLGYSVSFVAPGSRSYPFHFHHGEEEAFYVLEGRGVLRQGDGEGEEELIELGPGDVVAFPAGTGIAHQFINDGDVAVRLPGDQQQGVARTSPSSRTPTRSCPLDAPDRAPQPAARVLRRRAVSGVLDRTGGAPVAEFVGASRKRCWKRSARSREVVGASGGDFAAASERDPPGARTPVVVSDPAWQGLTLRGRASHRPGRNGREPSRHRRTSCSARARDEASATLVRV